MVDGEGNAVSMTSSIENAFGSRLMVRGFLLNNQLTDFSFRPEVEGRPVANRVEAGKRPRSSMAPTLVLGPDGRLLLAVGSPGGSSIIGYVAKTLVAALDWLQAAAEKTITSRPPSALRIFSPAFRHASRSVTSSGRALIAPLSALASATSDFSLSAERALA